MGLLRRMSGRHVLDGNVDDAVTVNGVRLAGADADHDDAEEIAEIIPAAVVGHGVDRDVAEKQRDDPGDREDEAVPQAEQAARRVGTDRGAVLPGSAGREQRQRHEGEEAHEDDAHEDEAHADEDAHEGEAGSDPHVWLDPQRLATVGTALADRLAEVDPDGAEGYRARAGELTAELTALDDELRAGLQTCERRQIVTSHDAFGYLADAYGLEQVAVAGLSPEDEASPQRLAEVAAQAEADGVTTIFFEELVSPKVAESLAREVGATATVLTPLEGAPGTGDYADAMRANLATLRTALDCT